MYTTPSIVFGFHGCDQSVADKILKEGQPLIPSAKSYDWLGHGIYFWEGSEARAMEWAKSKKVEKPAVVGAIIRLGNCLDLLDDKSIKHLSSAYNLLMEDFKSRGEPLPVNSVIKNDVSFRRDLDCTVVEFLHDHTRQEIIKDLKNCGNKHPSEKDVHTHPAFFDSVRGMFAEGPPLYSDAGFRAANHIQLCVVNPNCILGYFAPRKPDSKFKSF